MGKQRPGVMADDATGFFVKLKLVIDYYIVF